MKHSHFALPYDGNPIYLIADIHSNLPALQVVLEQIPASAEVLCAGDLLGYYTEPNEVCELLRQRNVRCIKGNHDKYVLDELSYHESREPKYRILPTRTALSSVNLEWLSSLPELMTISCFRAGSPDQQVGGTVQVAHGSPADVEQYIYPDTPVSFAWPLGITHLVLGHTHHPMQRLESDGVLINPGSVGQVRDRIPGAAYASLDIESGKLSFLRASYDVEGYQDTLRVAGVLPPMIEMLSRTRADLI